jgi:outer membrane immunogenic protein
MKKLLLGAVALVAVGAAPAFAADLPARTYTKAPAVVPVPVYNWTGCYVGGNLGGDWSRARTSEILGGTWLTTNSAADTAAIQANGSPGINASGVTVGGQIGCNWQTGNFVYGIEGDGMYTGLSSTVTTTIAALPTAGTPVSNTASVSAQSLYTLRGRAGYAVDRTLVYVTGGAAFGKVGYSDAQTYIAGATAGAVSSMRTGYVVGVGVEYALSKNWIVGGEYLYANLGSTGFNTVVVPQNTFTNAWSTKFQENIVRARISYKFDWTGPVVAKY